MSIVQFINALTFAATGNNGSICDQAPKRKVLWGLFTTKGHCDLDIVKWKPGGWHTYDLWIQCRHCGVTDFRSHISERDLQAVGFDYPEEKRQK